MKIVQLPNICLGYDFKTHNQVSRNLRDLLSGSLMIPSSSSVNQQISQHGHLTYPAVWFHTDSARTELTHC